MALGNRALKLQQYRAETRYHEIYHTRCKSLSVSSYNWITSLHSFECGLFIMP